MMIAEAEPEEMYVRSSFENDCQFVDVREPEEYAAEHIGGSVNIPLSRIDQEAMKIDKSRLAYLICNSGHRAERAALQLAQSGDRRTCVLAGGLKAWKAAGLPVEHAQERSMTIERQVRIVVGFTVLLGIAMAYTIYPAWIWLSAVAALGMIMSGVTGQCALGELLASAPWNKRTA